MNKFANAKIELRQLLTETLDCLTPGQEIDRIAGSTFKDWQNACQRIQKQMDEETLRVAVVGAIKSGKSTFVNSLFKDDYLKRGAGVVTSIVTRIRRGPYLKANLRFKSWDDVNAEIAQALTLFPQHEWEQEDRQFDIRRQGDREALDRALEKIQSNLLIVDGVRNPNGVLIESYLKGYDRVKDVIASENFSKVYEDDEFGEQKLFVGSDYLAVYLKDVLLEIRDGDMADDVEIADCQGSDSPNPRHLAMIQDYLLRTHLLIYVISSRTGVRQADLRFLSIIKQMGILDNIMFVVNCDFSEHESVEDLKKLVERTKEELAIIKNHSEIYVLSSLYNLFKASFKSMSPKEEKRYSQWQAETAFIELSDAESHRFQADLLSKLGQERYALLLRNNIERLDNISKGLIHWTDIHQDVLNSDADGVAALLDKMNHHQHQMQQVATLVNSTLQGASSKIKQDLKKKVDRFFDARAGSVVKDMLAFIRSYQLSLEPYEAIIETSRFTEVLYLVFQDFRAVVDRQIAEVLHPKIVSFMQAEESRIKTQLETVAKPFSAMVKEAMLEYQEALADKSIWEDKALDQDLIQIDLKSLKSRSNLKLPSVETAMRYSARIKSEAVLRLGFYAAIKVFRKLLKKAEAQQYSRKRNALVDGFKRMKLETERSIRMQFRDYQENIKFQYLFRLTDGLAQQIHTDLLAQFETYLTDTAGLIDLVQRDHKDKEGLKHELHKLGERAREFSHRIGQLRADIHTSMQS